jgi:mevalonate kinase
MTKTAKAIAPAKLIFFGEHSVVYPPNKVVIASLGLYLKVEATLTSHNSTDSRVSISSSLPVEFETQAKSEDLLAFLKQARVDYQNFLTTKDFQILKQITCDKTSLVALAVAIALDKVSKEKASIPSLKLKLSSKIPPNSGFGSSASLGSGIIGAILKVCEVDFNLEDIFNFTLELEKYQHGLPSGGDPATVIHGGIVEFYRTDKDKIIRPKPINNPELQKLLANSRVIYTGQPSKSTAEMVGMVAQKKQKQARVDQIFEQIEEVVEEFLKLLDKDTCSAQTYQKLIDTNGFLLEELGVVSYSVIDMSREIRLSGGSAKMCGGGGSGQGGSGAVLAYHTDPQIIEAIASKYGFEVYKPELAVPGLKV